MRPLHTRLALCLPLLAVACGGGSPSPAPPPSPPPTTGPPKHVFLITVDTLRADHLHLYGYPRETSPEIDRLGAEGVVFDRAIAQWPKTGPSFAALFTSRYPKSTGITHHAAVEIPAELATLPERFHAAGFETVAVVSNAVLGSRLAWNRGFDEYLETWSLAPELSDVPQEYRKWIDARKVNELALPLVERRRDAPRLFGWFHFSDPHAPYLLPEGEKNPFLGDAWYQDTTPVELENVEATALGAEREMRYYVAQYDANVRFADRHIGLLLAKLRELGLLDDALVIFSADHGESLGGHGYYFQHGRLPYNDAAHVPLVFWSPGRLAPRRVEAPVELIDVAPTVLELAGLGTLAEGIDGGSLGRFLEGRPAEAGELEVAFTEAGGGDPLTYYRAVQDPTWKLVFHPSLKRRKRTDPAWFELYKLDDDPAELRDLSKENEEEVRRLRRHLRDWMGTGGDGLQGPKATRHDAETVKALKALGYGNG